VHESLRMRRGHVADQGQIWADLAAKAQEHGVESPTFAMSDVFESRAVDLEAYGRALAPELGQVGAIVYVGSEWWALELLAAPKLFKKAWERLLPSYAMEALLSSPGGSPEESPEKRLAAILQAPLETFPAVGVGEDHRFQAGDFMGAVLVAEGRVAHLMAFPHSASRSGRKPMRRRLRTGDAMSSRMASNTALNCASYFRSSALSFRASVACDASTWRSRTKARIISTLT